MRALILAILLSATPAMAVQPDEMFRDPALEARAGELFDGLRCMVCRNESIAESGADLARDMRLLVRERIVAGDSDAQVIDFIVERYGEYALLRPTTSGANLILWIAAPAMLLLGGGLAFTYLRRRERAAPATVEGLSAEEEARLAELLKD